MTFIKSVWSECCDCMGKNFPMYFWCHQTCKYRDYNKKKVIKFDNSVRETSPSIISKDCDKKSEVNTK